MVNTDKRNTVISRINSFSSFREVSKSNKSIALA